MQDIFIEYMVKKEKTIQTQLTKALILFGAIIITLGCVLFGSSLGILSLLTPLIAVGACYGAYYLISSMNIEYEYAVTNGELDVDQIIAQRRRKRLVSVNCRQVEAFGRYKADEHQGQQYQTKIFACAGPDNDELWYAVTRLQQGGKTLVVFNANQRMLEGIKPFLPRPIMHEAFRTGNV